MWRSRRAVALQPLPDPNRVMKSLYSILMLFLVLPSAFPVTDVLLIFCYIELPTFVLLLPDLGFPCMA